MEKKKKYILDSNSLIKFKDFLFYKYDCYITEGVIKEIKDENSKKKLTNILPLLKIEKPEEVDINFIRYFSKLTGDLNSLSSVDIEVIALTYMLHRKYGDVTKLRATPLESIYKYDDVEYEYMNVNKNDKKKKKKKNNKINGIHFNDHDKEKETDEEKGKNEENEQANIKREDYNTIQTGEGELLKQEEIYKEKLQVSNDENMGDVNNHYDKNEIIYFEHDKRSPGDDNTSDKNDKFSHINDNISDKSDSLSYNNSDLSDDDMSDFFASDDEYEYLKKGKNKCIGFQTIKEEVVKVWSKDSCSDDINKDNGDDINEDNGDDDNKDNGDDINKDNGDDDDDNNEDNGDDDDDNNNDEGGDWINLNNFDKINLNINKDETFKDTVACITTDYAMQNVLYQIGLNVITIDGYKINSIKLWGYFCTSCYFFMRTNNLLFCSKCGNNNLRKVNVHVDNNLKKLVVKIPHIRVNIKNTIYSIPKKKNNKNNKNKFEDKLQIFREDELLIGGRKQFISHQKKLYESQKNINDPFNDDNFYDSNNCFIRTKLKSGKVAVLKNPKILVGGKKNVHRRKK
ncbi:RNA-binding protein NOB1, putative [Plasmodium sp. DRC-Itaito]|nr:RNA-binding protein NOB1, putative [Plasmodium sp. DRC-Itaito]